MIYATVIATPDLFGFTAIFLSAMLALCFLTITPTEKETDTVTRSTWCWRF